jgi:IS30 family transposase
MTSLAERNAEIVEKVRRNDASMAAIGAAYGLSVQSISGIAVRAGAGRPIPYGAITEAERATIVAMHADGASFKEIGERLGRCESSARGFLTRTGRHKPVRSLSSWTRAEDAVLRRRYGKPPNSAATIARELGRTRNEVIGRAYRLGLKVNAR